MVALAGSRRILGVSLLLLGMWQVANVMKDESARNQNVEKCLQRWLELDKPSAEKYLQAKTTTK